MRAVPRRYSGVEFRSTLEAEWAFNLDLLDIAWSYEPIAVHLDGINYLPDFWLPQINTWLEIKGPGVPGADKVDRLRAHVLDGGDDWFQPTTYVVLGLAPLNGRMTFKVSSAGDDSWSDYGALAECRNCRGRWFMDYTASFGCRCCHHGDGDHHLASINYSGDPWWVQNQWQPAA